MRPQLTPGDGGVYITDSFGERRFAPALWLRERSTSDRARSSVNHQRLVDPWTLPTDLSIVNAEAVPAGGVAVTFSDGHQCVLTPADLAADFDSGCPVANPWTGTLSPLPRASWPAIADGDSSAWREALAAFLRDGFLRITGVPCRDGAVIEVGKRFGTVRETNFGRYFNVRATPNPNDQAYTALPLGPHTDCNYRHQVPGIQLLHCLTNRTRGGESTLVDGLAVAQALKADDPSAYEHLAGIKVRFQFKDARHAFVAWHALIEQDGNGAFAAIHFSPRTDFVPLLPAETLEAFYSARRKLAQMLESPAFELRFRLDDGDLIIFNNHRLLHGRSAFDATEGERHLQGCYLDSDGPASLFRVLMEF